MSVVQPPSAMPRGPRWVPGGERTWQYGDTPFGRLEVVAWVPRHLAETKLPALIAFHGRGESLKGPSRGARGWLDDYHLERAAERLREPPLVRADFQGFVSDERLRDINEDLARAPYEELVVVMPYLPDILQKDRVFSTGPAFADFIVDELVPRMARELPIEGALGPGLDGVSLGGRAALVVGFHRPEAFRTVAGTQAALDDGELPRWSDLAWHAHQRNPKLQLRLLTSEDDYYRGVITRFGALLERRGLPHRLDVVQGDHSYEFNRGPGSIEVLLFHSRTLRKK